MSKILKRPMFRKGGNVGTGIMTGIVDRENYANGFPGPGLDQPYFIPKAGTRTYEDTVSYQPADIPSLESLTEENVAALLKAAGDRGGYDPLTSFLLQYGPAAAQQRGGGTLANLVAAAAKPAASLIKEKQKESDFLRSLRVQATGAAIKKRGELQAAEAQRKERIELANIDNIFKQKLADKQMDLQRELTNAEIKATYEAAKTQHEREMEKIAERQRLDTESRMKLLERGRELERMTSSEKIQQYAPSYAEEEYDRDQTKGLRRATFEFQIRDQIAENFGENKVGGHVEINMDNEKEKNRNAKSAINAGGANKIYYNVNDGQTYKLTEGGSWELFSLDTPKSELDPPVPTITGGEETVTGTTGSDIEKIYKRGSGLTELDKKILGTIKGTSEKLKEGQEKIRGPFR